MKDRRPITVVLPIRPEEDNEDACELLRAVAVPRATTLKRVYVSKPVAVDGHPVETELAASDRFRREGIPFERLGFRVESEILKGDPASEVLDQIELSHADLAVVRARRDEAEDARLGGMASALLYRAACPVFVHWNVSPGYEIHRILVPTDFSKGSRAAGDWGFALAEALGAELHLLHVRIPGQNQGKERESGFEQATREIARWRGEWNPRFLRPVTDFDLVTDEENVAEGILKFAEDLRFDLVVISTSARSSTWAWLLGSTAREVFQWSRCPVLALPNSNRVSAGSYLSKLASAASGGRPRPTSRLRAER
jgi:nucleotide-binding universal stress UspA family protein